MRMRKATILLTMLFLAVAAHAQEVPPPAILREVLQLNDDQMKRLGELLESRRAAVEPLAHQLAQAQQALGALLGSDAADPADVGKAMLTIRGLQRQVEQKAHESSDAFLATLTDGQRAQLQQIHGLEKALAAVQALHALGL